MRQLIDKFLLFLCGCAAFFWLPVTGVAVAGMLGAVTISALISYLDSRRFCWIAIGLCAAGGMVFPGFCAFLPLIFYDAPVRCGWWSLAVALPPFLAAATRLPLPVFCVCLLVLAVSVILGARTGALDRLETLARRQRDDSRELSIAMERRMADLREKQDYEVRLATLAERNRIAREIHDNVGHMLSRSILQVGAMLAVGRDGAASESLTGLRDTLSSAMDSVRESVHDLHDESLDLRLQLTVLARDFTFCPVTVDYSVESEMDAGMKYALIAIAREALSNIARHSDATRAEITVREHPGLYQLIVQDNGSAAATAQTSDCGIGLRNMRDRVEAMGGHIHFSRENGFRIFLSVPKPTAGTAKA